MLVLKSCITILLAAIASALPKSLPPRTFLAARNTTDLCVYVCQNLYAFPFHPHC